MDSAGNAAPIGVSVVCAGLLALAFAGCALFSLYLARRDRSMPCSDFYARFAAFMIACTLSQLVAIWALSTPGDSWATWCEALTVVAACALAAATARRLPLFRRHASGLGAELASAPRELEPEKLEDQREDGALRDSELRYRTLVDAGIVGIITADLAGNVVEANAAVLNMLGYSEDDLRSGRLRWAELTPPEWREHDARAIQALQTTGSAPAWEKEYIRKDGNRVPVVLGAAMLNTDTNTYVCFILDLTERKRTEVALERMREQHALDDRFRALLDTAPDAMIVAGADARITFVNAQAVRLFGYSRAELIGHDLALLIPERFRVTHGIHLENFFGNPGARPMGSGVELFGLRKDGTELPIEVSLSPLASAEGMTVSAAVRDITERKRMAAATRRLAERLSSAVETIQDAFALFDDEDRLVLCNSVYRALIGDEISGSLTGLPYQRLLDAWIPLIDFSNERERQSFRAERLGRRMQVETAAFDLRLLDGRSLRVIDRLTPEGGTVKTIWDLTDDVRLAEELREARSAAEEASRAKSEFLSSMSHELRTPLNAVLGFAQLLQRDKKEPLSARHRERVAQILKGGEHLLHLIDDILDLSRIESGKVAISIEPLNVAEVLEHVRTTLEPLAAAQELALAVEATPSALPLIAADRTRFVQILMNFGSNAIKYNRPRGSITFSVMADEPEWLRIAVRDTGIGIAPEQQSKLFQAFQRAGQETGPIEGTGIGLFITKRLAQLMNGEVGFRSELGVGSEFWVNAPVHRSVPAPAAFAQEVQAALAKRSSSHGRRRVLYVEDNPANVDFMRDLLDAFGDVDMLAATSAEAGLELARTGRPELIILDINLPRMSGIEALQQLRAGADTRHVPVIALSAAASALDKQRGRQVGFDAYLTKPVNVEEFVAEFERLITKAPSSV